MENNPVAPTDAQASASVASTTNSNEQAPFAAPPANDNPPVNQPTEPTPEQMAKYLGTTVEGLEKAKKFYENNGGFDKVFGERKKEITTPQGQQTQAQISAPGQNQLNDSITQTPPVTAQQLTGNLSMETIEGTIVKEYFKELASKPEFANIADKLIDGTVMEEAITKFNIPLFANGKVNTKQLGDFADMYSKTLPATPANTPMTNTPTVQPTDAEFTGPINTTQDALKVIQEHNNMVASGRGDHPKYADAQKFLNQGFNDRHKPQQGFEPWAARKARQHKQ